MREITVPSSAVALRSDRPLTPAMTSVVWELASALDASRTPASVPNAVWLELPSSRLRGEGGRADNVWLRECLDRLTGIKISGEWRGDPWGAVLVAQWELKEGGSMVRVLIPPAGVHALRSRQNFAKIEARAAHRRTGLSGCQQGSDRAQQMPQQHRRLPDHTLQKPGNIAGVVHGAVASRRVRGQPMPAQVHGVHLPVGLNVWQ